MVEENAQDCAEKIFTRSEVIEMLEEVISKFSSEIFGCGFRIDEHAPTSISSDSNLCKNIVGQVMTIIESSVPSDSRESTKSIARQLIHNSFISSRDDIQDLFRKVINSDTRILEIPTGSDEGRLDKLNN